MTTKEQEARLAKLRQDALQILGRLDIYSEEMEGKEFHELTHGQRIKVMTMLLRTGVIEKSGVTYA